MRVARGDRDKKGVCVGGCRWHGAERQRPNPKAREPREMRMGQERGAATDRTGPLPGLAVACWHAP